MKTVLSFLTLFVLVQFTTKAQLKIGLEIRPRAEFRNGFKELREKDEDPAFFVEQRSRLTASYSEDKLALKFSFQDIRIWGSVPQINKADALTSVHEAWGEVKMSKLWRVRFGRQEISYDNERILGSLDWAAQGRSHDALKFMFEDPEKKLSVHIAGAYNQQGYHTAFDNAESAKLFGSFYALNNYKVLALLHGTKTYDKAKLSFYFISNGVQRDTSKVFFTHTLGPYFTISPGKLKVEGSLFYQTGNDNSDVNVRAYLASLNASYPINSNLLPQIGIDYLSGNNQDEPSTRTAFDPLYGTHHAFYGFMDYFYVGNPHNQPFSGRVGLIDLYLKMRLNVSVQASLQAHYHYFSSPVQIKNEFTSYNRSLGNEIDLLYNSKITPNINLTVGYSQMFGTTTLEYIKGGEKEILNNWAFVMISLSPTIFSTEEVK